MESKLTDDFQFFKSTLHTHLRERVSNYLLSEHICDKITNDIKLKDLFPISNRKQLIESAETSLKVTFPKLYIPRLGGLFATLLFLGPIIILIYLFTKRIEFFLVPFSIIGFSIFIVLMGTPFLMVNFFFPNLFRKSEFNIKTFDDLIDSLVLINWNVYYENDCERLIRELKINRDSENR